MARRPGLPPAWAPLAVVLLQHAAQAREGAAALGADQPGLAAGAAAVDTLELRAAAVAAAPFARHTRRPQWPCAGHRCWPALPMLALAALGRVVGAMAQRPMDGRRLRRPASAGRLAAAGRRCRRRAAAAGGARASRAPPGPRGDQRGCARGGAGRRSTRRPEAGGGVRPAGAGHVVGHRRLDGAGHAGLADARRRRTAGWRHHEPAHRPAGSGQLGAPAALGRGAARARAQGQCHHAAGRRGLAAAVR